MEWIDAHDWLCWMVVGMVAGFLLIELGFWGLHRMVSSCLADDQSREPDEDACTQCRGVGLVPTLDSTSELFSDEYIVCPICEGDGLKWSEDSIQAGRRLDREGRDVTDLPGLWS
jgi:hypothetical protein